MNKVPPQCRPEILTHVVMGSTLGLVVLMFTCIVSNLTHYAILLGAGGGALVGFAVWLIRLDRYVNLSSDGRADRENKITVPTPSQRRANTKRAVQAQRRKLAQLRQKKSLVAQLNKPDFDSRLNQFVSENVDSNLPPESKSEPFVSKAAYWQREPFGDPTPPKPLSLVRLILLRIAKIVHGTGD